MNSVKLLLKIIHMNLNYQKVIGSAAKNFVDDTPVLRARKMSRKLLE